MGTPNRFALIFAMGHPESTAQAESIARNLEQAGYRCAICDYSIAAGFNPRRLAGDRGRAVFSLSDLGFSSILSLSAQVYRRQYGNDIDFPSLLALNLSQIPPGQLPGYDLLNPESRYQQKLRGFAARSEEILRAIRPDLVVIPQGAEVLSRILLAKAMKLVLPWLLHESPFFPGYLLLDPCGQHFMRGHNQIDRDWPGLRDTPLSPERSAKVKVFIDDWQARRLSKYRQPAQPSAELSNFLRGPDHLLFVPMQISHDANVHYGLGCYASLADFYQDLIDQLPGGWRIVFKPHPLDRTTDAWRPQADPRVCWAEDANIHDLIQCADAVAVFSSNVGLEALLYGKPVIVGGKPCYAHKGLTLDLKDRSELAPLLGESLRFQPDTELRDRLLHYITQHYLIRDQDIAALDEKLARTGSSQIGLTDPRRPFSEADPSVLADRFALLTKYETLFHQGCSHREILMQTGSVPDPRPAENPYLDKHLFIPWIAKQPPSLAAAYLFCTGLAPKGARILDYGCGTGFGSWLLADSGHRVLACEAAPIRLHYARRTWQHRRSEFIEASEAHVVDRINSRNFDLVLAIDELAYAPCVERLLAMLWGKVAARGSCLLRFPRAETAVRPDARCPTRVYTIPEVEALIASLPALSNAQHLFQRHTTISATPLVDYEHFWLVLEKTDSHDDRTTGGHHLGIPLPKTFVPVSDWSVSGLLKASLRRRRKLLGLP